MSIAPVFQAIRQQLVDNLPAGFTVDNVTFPNMPFDPEPGKDHITLFINLNNRERTTLGAKLRRVEGVVSVVLNSPKETHTQSHTETLDELLPIYDEVVLTSTPGVTVEFLETTGGDSVERDNYWATPLSTIFYYYE